MHARRREAHPGLPALGSATLSFSAAAGAVLNLEIRPQIFEESRETISVPVCPTPKTEDPSIN